MATTEKRWVRIEDWNGNIYVTDDTSSGSGDTSGTTITGDDIGNPSDGTEYTNRTDGTPQDDDDTASGRSILVVYNDTKEVTIASVQFDDLSFGLHSVVLRLKSSVYGNRTDSVINARRIIRVDTHFVNNDTGYTNPATLSQTFIYAKNFSNSLYTDIGFTFEYKGKHANSIGVRIDIKLLPESLATITFDYITIFKAYNTFRAIPTVAQAALPELLYATFKANMWSQGANGEYTQEANVANSPIGFETMAPTVGYYRPPTLNKDADKKAKAAYGLVSEFETEAGKLKAISPLKPPKDEFTVVIDFLKGDQ